MIEYTKIICSECGEEAKNSYNEPYFSDMLKHKLCYSCCFWRYKEQKLEKTHTRATIIAGCIYSPGNRTSGSFRGMAGRRFDIEYIEPSINVGKRITTFDLWSGGEMPDRLKAKFPDTAKFLNRAKRVDLGEGVALTPAVSDATSTVCWNPSQSRAEPYPLPNTLDLEGNQS